MNQTTPSKLEARVTALAAIRAAAIKANPDGNWQISAQFQRSPTLCDVLLAIGGKPEIHVAASDGGHAYFIRNMNDDLMAGWNLRQDDLTQQSDETIKFIRDILYANS
jgi:hypothetical protein